MRATVRIRNARATDVSSAGNTNAPAMTMPPHTAVASRCSVCTAFREGERARIGGMADRRLARRDDQRRKQRHADAAPPPARRRLPSPPTPTTARCPRARPTSRCPHACPSRRATTRRPPARSARRSSPPIAATARRSCTASSDDRGDRTAARRPQPAAPRGRHGSRTPVRATARPFSSSAPSAQAKARSASAAKAVCASQRGSSFIMRKRSRRERASPRGSSSGEVWRSLNERPRCSTASNVDRNALNFCRALPKLHEAHRSGRLPRRVEYLSKRQWTDARLGSSSRAVKSRAAYCRECAAAGLRARLCQIVTIMHR